MKFSNALNLPEPIVRAVTNDPYHIDSDFSVTGLLKPPRVAALERLHQADIVEDVSDRLWALLGQIGHLILERAALADYAEKRHTITRLGHTVSGQVDLWQNAKLIDYKITSIWTARDGLKPEWEQQCNLNALLCHENGIDVKSAEIVAIFRDWSVRESRRDRDYPQAQVMVFQVPLWPAEKQESFLLERIQSHLSAREFLPECTPEETWEKPEKWAAAKKGAKRATKLFEDKAECEAFAAENKLVVDHRPGERPRCESYCVVAPHCAVWQQWRADHR